MARQAVPLIDGWEAGELDGDARALRRIVSTLRRRRLPMTDQDLELFAAVVLLWPRVERPKRARITWRA